MQPDIAVQLRESIKRHEGLSKFPKPDDHNTMQLGYGRNITINGISDAEAETWLDNDIMTATMELYRFLPISRLLDEVRRSVLIEMVYNEGIEHLLGFVLLKAALVKNDYAAAAKEMLDSDWARRVGNRAQEMSLVMERGSYTF
jgi:lysozyme